MFRWTICWNEANKSGKYIDIFQNFSKKGGHLPSFFFVRLFGSAYETAPYHEIPASASGKKRRKCPVCTPELAILSARRTKLDAICTPPVIQQAILHLPSSSHRTRFPNLAPYGARLDISAFSLTPCTAHSLFGATEKRMGGAFFAAKPHVAPYSSCLVI